MDITKKYILMCDKAKEIQELWKPKEGDCFFAEMTTWYIGDAGFAFDNTDESSPPKIKYDGKPIPYLTADLSAEGWLNEKLIWLPRQDQLQNMIQFNDISNLFDKIFEYYTLNFSIRSDFWWKDMTMEQLWLHFVMNEKYNKYWNDESKKWKEKE